MEPSEAPQGTSGCPSCEGGEASSPMAPSHFLCHWQGPLEHDFLTALGRLMNSRSPAHEKQVPPGQAWVERRNPGSLCPATSPENHSLLGRCRTPIHFVPQHRPCRPSSPRGLLSGREARRDRVSLTLTLCKGTLPLQSSLHPQPGPPTVAYAPGLGIGPKNPRTSFFY